MRAAYVFVLAAGLGLAAFARDTLDIWVNATVLPPLQVETSVEVLDRNGALLRAYTVADGRWRLGVDLSQVDPSYIGALLAYEDKRFYDHDGVDPQALLRAAAQAVWNGHIVSGGSTLTMQVARLLDPHGRDLPGKLKQLWRTAQLEWHLSKDEILTLYLNRAPFGGTLQGVAAATLFAEWSGLALGLCLAFWLFNNKRDRIAFWI